PIMQELADYSGETVNLTVVDRVTYEGVCIETVDSQQSVKFSTRVGTTMPLHWGASHKILMAYLSPPEIDLVIHRNGLSPITEQTINKPELLKEELRRISLQGYAISREEVDLGAAAVAAPIFDQHGQITAGITIVGPLYRMQPNKLEMLIDRVRAASRDITAKIGGREWAGC
ncbi:MAG: IclR family transcriptional regulator, partial [Carboxydocellales bacterium]